MAEHPVPVSTGISDVTMSTEDGSEEVNLDPEHVSRREPNAIVAASDPVLSSSRMSTPLRILCFGKGL